MLKRQFQTFLTELLSQPTAPFREGQVMTLVADRLAAAGVPCFYDPHGNLVIGVSGHADYRKLLTRRRAEPVRVFIAHTDHPGFHGLQRLSPTRLRVKWHGGSPVRHLAGSGLWVASDDGLRAEAELVRAKLLPTGHAIDTAEIRLHQPLPPQVDVSSLYGGFRFRAAVWFRGQKLYTRAADDLVGVFAIVATALELFRHRSRTPRPFLGLLTRGEEVGFVGAIAHFELGWLHAVRDRVVAISLETSRTLPNARIGHGPIIRLGDRRTVFDPGYLRLLTDLAETLLPGEHQRRIMDGGTCEATAALAWNLPAIGISVPLGNYHNEDFGRLTARGELIGATRGPAPEYVHLRDIEGLLTLCRGLMQPNLAWDDPWRAQRQRLAANRRRYQPLIERHRKS